MPKQPIAYDDYFPQVNKILASTGLLLAAGSPDKPTNAMTIGWGAIGVTWGKPTWTVLVRPSRFTYQLIEEAGDFTVNVPSPDLADACTYLGAKSGRDHDKLAKLHLNVAPAQKVSSGVITPCPIIHECQVLGSADILPQMLTDTPKSEYYPQGDYHRVYFGQVLAAYADKAAAAAL